MRAGSALPQPSSPIPGVSAPSPPLCAAAPQHPTPAANSLGMPLSLSGLTRKMDGPWVLPTLQRPPPGWCRGAGAHLRGQEAPGRQVCCCCCCCVLRFSCPPGGGASWPEAGQLPEAATRVPAGRAATARRRQRAGARVPAAPVCLRVCSGVSLELGAHWPVPPGHLTSECPEGPGGGRNKGAWKSGHGLRVCRVRMGAGKDRQEKGR